MNEWIDASMNQLFFVVTGFFRCCSCSTQEPKAFESSCIGWDAWDAGAPSWNVVIDYCKILCRLLICYAFIRIQIFPFLPEFSFPRSCAWKSLDVCLSVKSWQLSVLSHQILQQTWDRASTGILTKLCHVGPNLATKTNLLVTITFHKKTALISAWWE